MENKSGVGLTELYTCSPKAIWRQVRMEHISFWLACGYLFFEYVRPQSIYTWLDFFPWASTFAVGAFLTAGMDKGIKPKGNPVNRLMLIYGVVILLSSVFAISPSIAFNNLDYYFNWLLIFFAIVRVVNTRERFFIFLLLYLLTNYKMSQHGFSVWVTRGFSFARWGVGGSPGWFSNSGEFGIQLTIFTPMAFAFVFALREHWGKLFKFIFYMMPITGIGSTIASSSRASMLGLVMVGAWSIKSSKHFFRALVLGALVGAVVWFVMPDEFKARFESSGEDRTSTHRLFLWKQAGETLLDYPLLGVGHKNWVSYYRKHIQVGEGTALVHNMFVESASEHGLMGFCTFVALFAAMFKLNKRTREHARKHDMKFEYYMSHGMDAAIIGMVVSAFFVTVLYYPYVWIHAAFVSCLYNSTCQPRVIH